MRYITAEDYQPHWRSKINTVVFSKKSRWSDNSYWFSHCRAGSRIATHQCTWDHRSVNTTMSGRLQHVHHPKGHVEYLKCFTCNARLKGPIKHCPNPAASYQATL